jgi:nitrile hydratase subunit beta
MDPVHYLSSSYYEHWLTGITTLLTEAGDVSIDGARLARPVAPRAAEVGTEPPSPTPRFAAGDAVRVRHRKPFGHTRCPGYVRGRVGTIERVEEPANVPEIEAHLGRQEPETVYGVRFDGVELWGEAAEPGTSVHVDLYERYLDPVDPGDG